ncbi:unnamed protein product [Didymodactylos carnosus]|uniref:Homeobox domain-containing protein n=1 Tax=Didymodactylos carnosus TaxID=1234261 RepID=A0A814FT57_9BILA|nr:unnamed protein product [Didymodactylos carnosus]CAF1527406.1 unnamed protein product [Didymodactylos carnosus]CAF3760129.1 unnamed protein product [Didymodactylos carnosus]CAF4314106.1 unnamed protein product [Didymodactylos carnosus]
MLQGKESFFELFAIELNDTGYNSITADIQENHSSDKENNKSTAKNKHKKTSNKTKKVTQERTKFTDIQKWTLNQFYSNQTRYPSSLEIERLGTQLSLSEAKIRVWFQNKRVRHKPGNMQITDNNSYGITQTPPPLLPTVPFILPNLCPLPLPSSIVNLREIYGQPEFRF